MARTNYHEVLRMSSAQVLFYLDQINKGQCKLSRNIRDQIKARAERNGLIKK